MDVPSNVTAPDTRCASDACCADAPRPPRALQAFVWNERCRTGIDEVDTQHLVLVELVNRVGELEANGADLVELRPIIQRLADYAEIHFSTEERLMDKAGIDPEHGDKHRRAHSEFVRQIGLFAALAWAGRREVLSAMLRYLVGWLTYHILGLGDDRAMARRIVAGSGGARQAVADPPPEDATPVLLETLGKLYELVAQSNPELHRSNRELERRVAQRTRELKQLEPDLACAPGELEPLRALKDEMDLEFLRQDVVDLLAESRDGLDRVKRIVQDLREFSRVDAAQWQQADVNAGLDSTLNVVRNEVKYKATVVKEYGELPAVSCIPAQIDQVFLNLIVNVAQAIADTSTITLRSGTLDERVFVEVEDTGCGMTPEVRARIFEPFYTTKPVGKGTGLGLSLAYGIVAKHGGSFDVKSEPGKGSAIRLWLPIERQPVAAAA